MKHNLRSAFQTLKVYKTFRVLAVVLALLAGCTQAPPPPSTPSISTPPPTRASTAAETPQPSATAAPSLVPPTPVPTRDPSLVGEWHLDGDVIDSSGNNNNGKLVDGSFDAGIDGQAAVLNGAGSYVEIPDSPSLADGAASSLQALTVSIWINLNNLPQQNIAPLVKEHAFRLVIGADGTGHFVIATADNSWYANGTLVSLNTRLWLGDWHHLVATYNGATLKTYVDGVLKGVSSPKISGMITSHAKPMGRTTTTINNPLRFGYKSSSNIDFMDGKIDEVRIYNRALNGSEVKALFRAFVPPDAPTAEPLATSTPVVPPDPTPTRSTMNDGLPYKDDFSNPGSGWEIAGDTGYQDGAYVIKASDPQVFLWALARRAPLANIHLQVTAKNTTAVPDASFGMICNYQDDGNFYFLGIGSDGVYTILKMVRGQPVYLSSTQAQWVISDKIPKNAASYQLGADCTQGALTLYVNGQKVAAVQDSTFTQGDVGLAAMNDQNAPSEISFDDFSMEAIGQ
jgi:hypothetical protein